MQEKKENSSTVKFLSVFGPKVLCGEQYFENDDTTDQRAPVNNPQELYNQFVLPAEVMDELDAETIDDFDNDVYDYEDRTDYGVDVADAAEIEYKRSKIKTAAQKPVPNEPKPVDEPVE